MKIWECKILGALKCYRFRPLWSNFGCRQSWVAPAASSSPRYSGRHAVCSGHVAVSVLWQHQTAAVTSDIITGVGWILFLDGSLPQSTLGSDVWDAAGMENLKGRQMLPFSCGILKVLEPHTFLFPQTFRQTQTCRGIQLFSQSLSHLALVPAAIFTLFFPSLENAVWQQRPPLSLDTCC